MACISDIYPDASSIGTEGHEAMYCLFKTYPSTGCHTVCTGTVPKTPSVLNARSVHRRIDLDHASIPLVNVHIRTSSCRETIMSSARPGQRGTRGSVLRRDIYSCHASASYAFLPLRCRRVPTARTSHWIRVRHWFRISMGSKRLAASYSEFRCNDRVQRRL